jgi:transcriptional regulator with XRE-family HTH domain
MTGFGKRSRAVTPFDRRLGECLKAARLAANLSQEELGVILGVTYQQIQNYESGKSALCGVKILQACEALKIAPNQLLGWDKPSFWGKKVFCFDSNALLEFFYLLERQARSSG